MKASLVVSSASLLLGLAGCSHTPAHPSAAQPAQGDSERLHQIVDEYTEGYKRLDAFVATLYGVEDLLDQFGDYPTPAYFARSKALFTSTNEKLKAIHPETLSSADQVLYRLISEDLKVSIKRFDFPTELLEFNQMGNTLHSYMDDSNQDLTSFPFDSVKHYDAFIKRSEGFPAYVDAQIALLRRGIKERIVLGCDVAKKTPNTYHDALEPVVEKNPFFRPIGFMPKDFSSADRARLTEGFRMMIQERIIPGYQKFDHFFRTEYLPHCRKGFGIGSLPNGKNWYKYAIWKETNLQMDPRKIHELGLKEVARIAGEMEQIKNQLGYKGSLKSFLKFVTHRKSNYYKSAKDMFAAFQDMKTRVAAKIPQYFKLIPKSDYTIVETSNPEDAAGSYNNPTDMIPHGRFVVNTKNLHSVATFGLTTLSLHETIPGHHFQLALQFEDRDQLTEYQRKIFMSNSFVEGWALYAEYLGNEMGFFDDPMQRLGNRSDEMLRAVRLVVDTGIHAYGWDRQKAYNYMMEYLPGDPGDVSNEVNRYSVWPGQALGYKLGQLKIIELRKEAEKRLGPKFDIREFHRRVIGNGTLSLGVLDAQIHDWIAGR